MRILLVNPPLQRLKGINYVYFPLGLGYVAAALRDAGHQVRVYNAEVMEPGEEALRNKGYRAYLEQHERYLAALDDPAHPVWQRIDRRIREHAPELVGISVMTAKVASAVRVSRLVKAWSPECPVIWGGPHPAAQLSDLDRHPEVDACTLGEAEETVVELVAALEEGRRGSGLQSIRGLGVRGEDGRFAATEARPRIEDLDRLPFPAKDLNLVEPRYDALAMGALVTVRGCPFQCGFCDTPTYWGRKVRFRSAAGILEEIRHLKERYGTREIFFWDDTFTVRRQHVLELCAALLEQRVDVIWRCTSRVDCIDDEMLALMRRSGCVNIDVGVESGSDRTLQEMHKGETRQQMIDGIRQVRAHGINVNAYFMLGFPEETEEDIRQTIDLMRTVDVGRVYLSIFTPYPGTDLFAAAQRHGFLPERPEWHRFSHQSPDNHFMLHVPRERFRELVREAAEVVDRKNSRPSAYWRQLVARRRYFLRHPVEAARIATGYARKLFG